jgi:hypothetical protein
VYGAAAGALVEKAVVADDVVLTSPNAWQSVQPPSL